MPSTRWDEDVGSPDYALVRRDTAAPKPIPVIPLGRLAVDRKEQGHGLGSHLLRDAIARTRAGSRDRLRSALLVHALNERDRDFYLHHDFEPAPTGPLHLMLPMTDARAIVSRQAQRQS
jgi:GNAT superfamily N-acetyltransferase